MRTCTWQRAAAAHSILTPTLSPASQHLSKPYVSHSPVMTCNSQSLNTSTVLLGPETPAVRYEDLSSPASPHLRHFDSTYATAWLPPCSQNAQHAFCAARPCKRLHKKACASEWFLSACSAFSAGCNARAGPNGVLLRSGKWPGPAQVAVVDI